MAYNVTGTSGSDTLDQFANTGPGTIVGLAGDDSVLTGTGNVSVAGSSGNDSILLQNGNSGTINGGSENDIVSDRGTADLTVIDDNGFALVNPMLTLGGDGADTIILINAQTNQTIVGGNDSADGGDFIIGGFGSDLIFGNGGDDVLEASFDAQPTVIGGHGDDIISGGSMIFGNEGSDLIIANDNATVFGGLGDDAITSFVGGLYFGNEGGDFIEVGGSATVVGGNDSADGDDLLSAFGGDVLMFGNGGDDLIFTCSCVNSYTLIGGFGNDTVDGDGLIFGNEGDDFIISTGLPVTVFGGLGNDGVVGGFGRDTIQGNEGNDTLEGFEGIDTVAGGSGNDFFAYEFAEDDGDNATGGGPVDRITDLNFDQDRFLLTVEVTFAANLGAGTGADLNASANNAVAAAFALSGDPAALVAAQFTFGGRTYLAIDLDNAGAFDDFDDLLIDITGVTGTIGANDFVED